MPKAPTSEREIASTFVDHVDLPKINQCTECTESLAVVISVVISVVIRCD